MYSIHTHIASIHLYLKSCIPTTDAGYDIAAETHMGLF